MTSPNPSENESLYISWDGLDAISSKLTGKETMGIGIRPFGFHAGNMASIVAYPILLCELMSQKGKEPEFDIYCFFNDVEQHAIVGHESRPDDDDSANIYPADKTLQYTPGPDGFKGSVVDYWRPLIENGAREIQARFPKVKLSFHTTSDLKTTETFGSAVRTALTQPEKIAEILEQKTGLEVYRPADYMRAVCKSCSVPVKNTAIDGAERISAVCHACGTDNKGEIGDFDFWIHHSILTLPKLSVGPGFDIWMMGSDHVQYGETPTRLKLSELFGIKAKNYIGIHAPLILSYDGQKMGKSNHNQAYVPLDSILNHLRENRDHKVSISGLPYNKDISVLGDLLPAHIRTIRPL